MTGIINCGQQTSQLLRVNYDALTCGEKKTRGRKKEDVNNLPGEAVGIGRSNSHKRLLFFLYTCPASALPLTCPCSFSGENFADFSQHASKEFVLFLDLAEWRGSRPLWISDENKTKQDKNEWPLKSPVKKIAKKESEPSMIFISKRVQEVFQEGPQKYTQVELSRMATLREQG